MDLYGRVCRALYGLKWHFMVFYGRKSSFLAVIDSNSFGLLFQMAYLFVIFLEEDSHHHLLILAFFAYISISNFQSYSKPRNMTNNWYNIFPQILKCLCNDTIITLNYFYSPSQRENDHSKVWFSCFPFSSKIWNFQTMLCAFENLNVFWAKRCPSLGCDRNRF